VVRAWLDAVFRVARTTTPALGAEQLRALWATLAGKPCAAQLSNGDAAWLNFLQAVALRQGAQVAELGQTLLVGDYVFDSRAELSYAAQATISASIGQRDIETARTLLQRHAPDMAAAGVQRWTLELLQGMTLARQPADR
jgi:hypothetical protein